MAGQFELPKAICVFPLPGWRLREVRYDDEDSMALPGWVVRLDRERGSRPMRGGYGHSRIQTRSTVGPLEAWDEAVQAAQRDNLAVEAETTEVDRRSSPAAVAVSER